ncbi:hypothetical protein DFJ73DRAFT_960749, partial [Zopfochytrium polystomum]
MPSRRHPRRHGPCGRFYAPIALRPLLLLAAVLVLLPSQFGTTLPFALAAGPSSSSSSGSEESKAGTTQIVGGVSIAVGDKVANQGKMATVYHAKHGSDDVIYKEARRKFWANEVDATRAAGQLVAEEGGKIMVQKKVGTTGVKDWLRTQKANPE